MTVDELFVREPEGWGLRGDPHVWREMRERLRDRELPANMFTARDLFEKTLAEVASVDLGGSTGGNDDVVYRAELATGSGISDGCVSRHWWKHTGVPILVDRWAAAIAQGTGSR